nr:hypothetical protein [Tanacetum cinerariifolium]
METIHVQFDELKAMAAECNNSELDFNCSNFQDSSKDLQSIPSKTDLDNFFGPVYKEHYATSTPEVTDNSAVNTIDNEDTLPSSSIVVEEDEAPQIVSSSEELVDIDLNTPVSNENADELVQEDVVKLDRNVFYNSLHTPVFEEAESSSTYQDPSITIRTIESSMQMVGYQGVVDKVSAFYMKFLAQLWQTMFKDFLNCVFQNKDVIQYPLFTKLIIADLMKKFPSIPQRLDEDYHSIKDDIPLVSVYSTRNVLFRHLRKKRKQVSGETSSPRQSLKVTIKQKLVVKGEKNEEEYASKFAVSIFDVDVDDFGNRLEPGSHKKNLKVIDDDDVNDDEKKDEKKDDVGIHEMGSLENRTEKMQSPIPTTPTSPRINLSLDKTIVQELIDTVSPSTATTSKDPQKEICISNKYSHLPRVLPRKVHGKVYQVLYEIVPQLAERVTNDLIEENLKRVVTDTVIQERDAFQSKVPALISKEFDAHAPKIIEERFEHYVQINVIQVHPTKTTSTDTTSSANLQQQLYLKMKSNLQAQANDSAL